MFLRYEGSAFTILNIKLFYRVSSIANMSFEQSYYETAEYKRLQGANSGKEAWRRFGPYLAERAWGTVREDYSSHGDAWRYFPFNDATSRAYRWNEDGIGGICDVEQSICLAFGFWNGVDPFIKERFFGLSNDQGNHGEDVKEVYNYEDSTPTHSYMRLSFKYTVDEFPYDEILTENAKRSRVDDEFEVYDTQPFAAGDLYDIQIEYAKVSVDEYAIEITVTNESDHDGVIHILPTLWFRDTWTWRGKAPVPSLSYYDHRIVANHYSRGTSCLVGDGDHRIYFCDNETNLKKLYNLDVSPKFPKDGINDFLVKGSSTVNPNQKGTKGSLHYKLPLKAGASSSVRVIFIDGANHPTIDFGSQFSNILAERRREADEFYDHLIPASVDSERRDVARAAFAGMLWSKQFYHYDVERWLSGDPNQVSPPGERFTGRNTAWSHFHALDVISMPDAWEYPWFAVWDLAFHTVTLAYVDPEFSKRQLILLCREWYMHPSGALPAYEWSFDDANPPVHAWAALKVFEIDGACDFHFLEKVFHKLLINFTWWVNRKDAEGNNVFQGGFLGLDNIGPFNRSELPPEFGRLEQSDGTAWMALYSLSMLDIAITLAEHDNTYEDVATKFFEHFCYIASAMDAQGLWNEEEGFYFDQLRRPNGESDSLKAFSMVGLIAVCAVSVLGADDLNLVPQFNRRLNWFIENKQQYSKAVVAKIDRDGKRSLLLGVVRPERLVRILERVLSEEQFLSTYGLRALSKFHKENPLVFKVGDTEARLDYEPGESSSPLFGGNSNWRGPIWFPVNFLFIDALRRYGDYVDGEITVEFPTGSQNKMTLDEVANELSNRLISLFTLDETGHRPSQPNIEKSPILFHEFFNGDNGKGLGASHQTGWTGLVANLIIEGTGE